MEKLSAEEIIRYLGLQPLPIEGGYFSVTYTSKEQIQAGALPERYKNKINLGGAIYFLETHEQFSAMHRLPTDELYYYHYGLKECFTNLGGMHTNLEVAKTSIKRGASQVRS